MWTVAEVLELAGDPSGPAGSSFEYSNSNDFLLGVVYAIAFRLVSNLFVLWPLVTPMGAFYNNVDAGDIDLPWASIAGFTDVAVVMAVAVWFSRRHRCRALARESEGELARSG